jgi:hypothetical protein
MKARRPEGWIDPRRLPHWARVAFAARCARRVLPLFLRYWPNVRKQRLEPVVRAIELAEHSAAVARLQRGLSEVALEATASAGAAYALATGHGPAEEPTPSSRAELVMASLAARSAESAASAAEASPGESALYAYDAYGFAIEAARGARAITILIGIEDDYNLLHDYACRARWKDSTGVGPELFERIA